MGVVFFKYIDNLLVMRFLLGDGVGGGMLTNNLEGTAKIDPLLFGLDFHRYPILRGVVVPKYRPGTLINVERTEYTPCLKAAGHIFSS